MQRTPAALLVLALLASTAAAQNVPQTVAAFRAAALADDFGAMKAAIQGKSWEILVPSFQVGEARYAQAKLAGAPGEKALSEERIYLEQFATINKLYGTRLTFMNERFNALERMDETLLKARVQLQNDYINGVNAYFDAMQAGTEGKIKEALPKLEAYRATALAAKDYYHQAQAEVCFSKLFERLPDWFAVGYTGKAGETFANLAASNGMPQSKLAIERLGLSGSVKNAKDKGQINPDWIDVSLPLEEARKAYIEKEKEAGAATGAGGASSATSPDTDTTPTEGFENMPPAPNEHGEDVEMGWVTDTKFKVGKAPKRKWDSHWFWDNAPINSWRRHVILRDATVAATIMPDPAELENDGGKIFLHPKGKGNARATRLKVPAKPKVTPIPMQWSDGTKAKMYYELSSLTTWQVNGYEFRASGGFIMVWRGASVLKGKIRGVPVEFWDTNGNGNFNDYGQDSFVVGKGRKQVVQPLSKYVVIEDKMYELKMEPSGSEVRTRPYDGPLAMMRFEFEGKTEPLSMVVQGNGADQNYYYDLANATKDAVWVRPGTHQLWHGVIKGGRGSNKGAILIQPDRNTKTMQVRAKRRHIWKMGAGEDGFTAEFDHSVVKDGGKRSLRIPGTSVAIRGQGGELYRFSSMGIFQPNVEVRRGESGPAVVKAKFKRASPNETSAEGNSEYAPKSLDEKMPFGGNYSIRLVGTYAPLGKVQSPWKKGVAD